MPVTVTFSRGQQLPWPAAIAFTVVGAGMVIYGFAVVGRVDGGVGGDVGSDITSKFVIALALLFLVPAWCLYFVSLARRSRERRAAAAAVPDELAEPPGGGDPAVIATVVGNGTPAVEAVAATVLGLAQRNQLDIQEHGDRVVISIPSSARAATRTDAIVLAGLVERASSDGDVVGPPIWVGEIPGWTGYVQDARARGIAAGLVETRIPFVGLMVMCVLTATALSIIFFWYIVAFIGFILLANGLPHLVVRASGYRLTPNGASVRAQWKAFGRYLHEHESLRDVGPSGVVVWGPNLVYGVLLGEGEKAARLLSPG